MLVLNYFEYDTKWNRRNTGPYNQEAQVRIIALWYLEQQK